MNTNTQDFSAVYMRKGEKKLVSSHCFTIIACLSKGIPPKNMLKLVGVAQQSTEKFKWLEYVCMT